MRSDLVDSTLSHVQNRMYDSFNEYAKENPIKGRLLGIPVVLFDVTLETLKVLRAIEYAALAALNLVGAAFSEKYSLKESLEYTEYALNSAWNLPVTVLMIVPKVFYQLYATMRYPERVLSINYGVKPDSKHVYNWKKVEGPISEESSFPITRLQNKLYDWLNDYSSKHPLAGRVVALPVVLLDVTIELLKSPVAAIYYLAGAVFFSVKATYSEENFFKEALIATDGALRWTWSIPIAAGMVIPKIFYQLYATLRRPERVYTIDYYPVKFPEHKTWLEGLPYNWKPALQNS